MLLAESTRLLSRLVSWQNKVVQSHNQPQHIYDKAQMDERRSEIALHLHCCWQTSIDSLPCCNRLSLWLINQSITHSLLPYLASFPEKRRWVHVSYITIHKNCKKMTKNRYCLLHFHLTQRWFLQWLSLHMIFSLFEDKSIENSLIQ